MVGGLGGARARRLRLRRRPHRRRPLGRGRRAERARRRADRTGRASRACRRSRSPRTEESASGQEPISGQEPTQTSPLRDRRDRPAVAVALRVSRRDARAPHLHLRRARGPGRHAGDPQHHLDRRPAQLVGAGARRPGPGDARRRRRRPGSRPTRSAATPAARRSSPAPASRRCAPGSGSSRCPSTRPTSSSCRRTSPRRRDHRRGPERRPARRARGGRPNERPAAPQPQPRPEVVTRELRKPRQAWIERATSADHKTVALLFIATALTFLALAATEFALMRMQLIVPENALIQPEIFNRLMTRSVVTFVVLACLPLALGPDQLHRPAADRRPRRRPAAPQPALLLALRGRRGDALRRASSTARRRPARSALPPLSDDLVFSPSNGADAWIAGTGARLPRLRLLGDQHDRHPAPAARARASPGGGCRCSPGPRP